MPELTDVEQDVLSYLKAEKGHERAHNIVEELVKRHEYTTSDVVDAIWSLSERNRVNVDLNAVVRLSDR